MADTRCKNFDWTVRREDEWEGATLAVLMDIRDELRSIRGSVSSLNHYGTIHRELRGLRRDVKSNKRCRRPHSDKLKGAKP